MWPTLISFGGFHLSSSSVVALLGFFLAGFVFWRRGKEEHYSEIQLFDSFLLSFIVGTLGARIGFILLHWDRFGIDVLRWINFWGYPGLQNTVFLIVATFFMQYFATKKKWDTFEVLDFWSLSLTMWLLMTSIGEFLSGTGRGNITESFVGIIFPGSIEKTHPVQLYAIIFFLGLYAYLNWAESRYRTFEWYRLGKKAAQTGFLMSNFWIFWALFSSVMLFFRLPEFTVRGMVLDGWVYGVMLFLAVRMLLGRSDKPLFPVSFRERWSRKKQESNGTE